MKNAGMVVLIISPFNSPMWSVHKTDGPWGMIVNYLKRNEVVVAALALDVLSLLE